MNARGGRAGIPELREFLDNLPLRPCPAKLPENYCKMCKRLNGEVYNYCQKQELPPRPVAKPLGESVVFERREEKPEIPEEPKPTRTRIPILEKPTYDEGETPLEFVPSQKSIEEAKKSLPRFIPVQKKPRAFKPLEEPAQEEFMAFDMEKPSIFKSPESLAEGGGGMMFTLVSDEVEAIEVIPLEIASEDVISTESVFESADGVVETVEIGEVGEFSLIEEEAPVFEFIEEEPEIVEVVAVEEETIPEDQSLLDSIEEAERGIKELADEISGMTEELEYAPTEEGRAEEKVTFAQFKGPTPPGETPPMAESEPQLIPEKAEEAKPPEEQVEKPKKKLKLKRKLKRKVKVKKPEPMMEEPREEGGVEAGPDEEVKPPEELAFKVEEKVAFEPRAGFEITEEAEPPEESRPEALGEEEKPKKRLKLKRKLKKKVRAKKPEPMVEEPREEEIEGEKVEAGPDREAKPPEELTLTVDESAAFEPSAYEQPPKEAEQPVGPKPEAEEGELPQEEEISHEIKFQVPMKIEPGPTEEVVPPEEPKAVAEGEGETLEEEEGERKPKKKILLKKKKKMKMKKLKVKRSPKTDEK